MRGGDACGIATGGRARGWQARRRASDGGEGGEARGQAIDRHARGPQDLARAPPPPQPVMHSPSQREADFDLWYAAHRRGVEARLWA